MNIFGFNVSRASQNPVGETQGAKTAPKATSARNATPSHKHPTQNLFQSIAVGVGAFAAATVGIAAVAAAPVSLGLIAVAGALGVATVISARNSPPSHKHPSQNLLGPIDMGLGAFAAVTVGVAAVVAAPVLGIPLMAGALAAYHINKHNLLNNHTSNVPRTNPTTSTHDHSQSAYDRFDLLKNLSSNASGTNTTTSTHDHLQSIHDRLNLLGKKTSTTFGTNSTPSTHYKLVRTIDECNWKDLNNESKNRIIKTLANQIIQTEKPDATIDALLKDNAFEKYPELLDKILQRLTAETPHR